MHIIHSSYINPHTGQKRPREEEDITSSKVQKTEEELTLFDYPAVLALIKMSGKSTLERGLSSENIDGEGRDLSQRSLVRKISDAMSLRSSIESVEVYHSSPSRPSTPLLEEVAKPVITQLNEPELSRKLEEISLLASFEERIKSLEQIFHSSMIQLKLTASAPADLKERTIYVYFNKGPYFSEGIPESCLEKSNDHYHIKAYESIPSTDTKPLVHIRVCAKHGELVSINKGKEVTGKGSKYLYRLFEKCLKGMKMYLFDDAKIDGVTIRLFLELASKDPYYKDVGFTEMPKCENWIAKNGIAINPSPEKYQTALENIRNKKIKQLYYYVMHNSEVAKSIGEVVKTVLKTPETASKTPLWFFRTSEETLGAMIQKMDTMRSQGTSPTEILKMQFTLEDFFWMTFDSKGGKQFNEDFDVLGMNKVYLKTVS